MHAPLLQDIGLCIVAATGLAFVARVARQPLILAYILAGVLIGPPGFGLIHDGASITQISELGLAFLLFIVGLEIDLKQLVQSGRIAAIVGVIQVVACALLAWLVALALGFRGIPALYLGVATAFSSTMIVVKILSDKSELDTVAGRITLGVLLVQDVLAIVVLAVQPNLADPQVGPLAVSLVKGAALVGGTLLISRYLLPRLFQLVAKNPEILLIAAISWCFLVSWAAVQADFSIAMGALIAGVSMSTFPYSLDVIAKIRSLRDFFVTLFFVSLGMHIALDSAFVLFASLALSVIVMISRFPPVVATLHFLRYGYRVGIVTSLSLAQASEFALVIASIGLSKGHITPDIVSIIAVTMVVTSTVSTYLIQANHGIAGAILRRLAARGIVDPQERETRTFEKRAHPIVLVGCHRVASSLVPLLVEDEKDFLVIDFSPEVHSKLKEMQVPCAYGDISHVDTLEHAGAEHAKVLLCTISDDFLRGTGNLALLKQLRRMNPHAKILCHSDKIADAQAMYDAGADYVLLPRHVIAEHVRDLLRRIENGTIDEAREHELAALRMRQEVVP